MKTFLKIVKNILLTKTQPLEKLNKIYQCFYHIVLFVARKKQYQEISNMEGLKNCYSEHNFRSTSTRAKLETKKREKEDNINFELAHEKNSEINNRDLCLLCNRRVKIGVECEMCSEWFHYKYEGTTGENLVKEFLNETH